LAARIVSLMANGEPDKGHFDAVLPVEGKEKLGF
jgi:hypothetical protein